MLTSRSGIHYEIEVSQVVVTNLTLDLRSRDRSHNITIQLELESSVRIGRIVLILVGQILHADVEAQLGLATSWVGERMRDVDRSWGVLCIQPVRRTWITTGGLDTTVAIRTEFGVFGTSPAICSIEISDFEYRITFWVLEYLTSVAVEILLEEKIAGMGLRRGHVHMGLGPRSLVADFVQSN